MLAKEFNVQIDDIFIQKLHLFEQTIINMINNSNDICTDNQREKCKIEYGKNFDWACKNCDKNLKNGDVNGK